jgi:predicted ATPase
VDLLAYWGQRLEPARLLVLGTYRPVDTMLRAHPLRRAVQELCGRGQALDLALEFLPAADVLAYVAGRCGGPVAPALAAFVYQRTNGNALFMVNVAEHLVQQGLIVRREGLWTLREGTAAEVARVPNGVRQLLVRRIEELPPEARQVLEAASAVGEVFTVGAVAAGLHRALEDVQAACDALAAHHHFIEDTGVTAWPDGTRGGSYRFQHALYPQVQYDELGSARRGNSTGALAPGCRPAMGRGRGRLRPSLPSTSNAGGRSNSPCTLGSTWWTRWGGAMPITKRLPPSPKG